MVIPAYNSGKHVEKTILSLLQQTYPALRILVIDDCSEDDTVNTSTKYQDKVEVLQNKTNSGLAYSLNRALSMAKEEEILFILEDDVELIGHDYLYNGLHHFENSKIALVCGQANDFNSSRLTFMEKAFGRFLNLDYQETGVTEQSYSLLKADFIRIKALKTIGGFGFAGNPKLGVEDQILAKKLKASGYSLIKDTSLKYSLGYGRNKTLTDFLHSESNAGRTMGVAIMEGLININPSDSDETRQKSTHRRIQVAIVSLIYISLFSILYSHKLTGVLILSILATDFALYLKKSKGFKGRERIRFGSIGLLDDFVFSTSFFRGIILGIKSRVCFRSKRQIF